MQDNIRKTTGKILKNARKNNNLTLEDVSKLFDKSKSWLGDIESGRNRIYFDDLKKLCELYMLDMNDIITELNNKDK